MIKQLEHQIRQWAESIVDRAVQRGECDFVSEIAYKLPMNVIADIVGILILLLEERIVAGFDFDIVIRHDRNPVVADIGFNEQIQHGFCARWRLAVIDHCRCAKSTFRLEA